MTPACCCRTGDSAHSQRGRHKHAGQPPEPGRVCPRHRLWRPVRQQAPGRRARTASLLKPDGCRSEGVFMQQAQRQQPGAELMRRCSFCQRQSAALDLARQQVLNNSSGALIGCTIAVRCKQHQSCGSCGGITTEISKARSTEEVLLCCKGSRNAPALGPEGSLMQDCCSPCAAPSALLRHLLCLWQRHRQAAAALRGSRAGFRQWAHTAVCSW